MSDQRAMMMYDASKKSALVAYVLWFFVGMFGGHRFYLKKTGSALFMLIGTIASIVLTFVLIGFLGLAIIGLWVLVDAFLIPGMVEEHNQKLARQLS